MRALSRCFALLRAGLLGGFVFGAATAGFDMLGREHVREFQTGAADGLGTKLYACAMRACVEGVGFGALALLLALVALAWSALLPRDARTSDARRHLALFVLLAGGLWCFCWKGGWLGREALPFLSRAGLVAYGSAGILGAAVGLSLFDWIARRLPMAEREERVASALAAALLAWSAARLGLALALEAPEGPTSAPVLLRLAGLALGALLGSVLLGRLLAPVCRSVAARLARGRLVPLSAQLALGVSFAASCAWPAGDFSLHAPVGAAHYAELGARPAPPGPNVLYVVIDTLRADHLGCYGYERDTSPFLDELAAGGTRFDDPVAAAAWTKPATGTLLTGLYPSRHGALYHGSELHLPEGHLSLAETMRRAGYVSAGFISNPNIKRQYKFDVGFDEYFDSPVEDTIALASMRTSWFGRVLFELTRRQFNWKYENDAASMNRHVTAWLESNHERPFFLYVHYIDPHSPYAPPAEYARRFQQQRDGLLLFNERERELGQDLYDGEIRYVDDQLRALSAEMRRLGVWEDTLVVVTSDHGEEWFEHDVQGHGFSLYQGVVRVPLIFAGPNVPAGHVVEEPVQTVDLAATMLDLAEVGQQSLGDGHSFRDALSDEAWYQDETYHLENEFGMELSDRRSFVFNGVRRGRWKLVLTEADAYKGELGPQLYDLESDPLEQHNLITAEQHHELIQELIDELYAHTAFLDETGFRDLVPARPSAETAAHLAALGYGGDE